MTGEPALPGTSTALQAYEADDEIDPRQTLRVLWRRKMLLFVAVGVFAALALSLLSRMTAQYSAETLLMIDPRKPQVMDSQAVVPRLTADLANVQSEVNILKSRAMVGKIVDKLNLTDDPELNPRVRKPESGLLANIDLKRYLPQSWVAFLGTIEEVPPSLDDKEELRRDVIDAFLGRLTVWPQDRSYVISVRYKSQDPKKAMNIVNTLADVYIADQLEARFGATRAATIWLNQRLTELAAKLKESEEAVENYRSQANLVGSKGATVTAQQLSELNTQLILAQVKRAEAEAHLRQTKSLVATSGIEASPDVLASSLVQRLRETEADAQRRAADLMTRYGERHPAMLKTQAELRDIRGKIQQEVGKVVHSLANEVEVARTREETLRSSLGRLENRTVEGNKNEVRLRELEREATATRTLYESMLTRVKQTATQENLDQPDARIVARADLPAAPSFPKGMMVVGFAFLTASVLGVVLVFLIDRLDSAFRSADQVERVTGYPSLGLVPMVQGFARMFKKPEDYVLEAPSSVFGAAIQSLRTSLMVNRGERRPKTILVTSSIPEEGKTSVSACLARSAARSGQRVLLIDCDLGRPRLHDVINGPERGGLVELLTGSKTVDEVVRIDPKSGLHFIPAGGADLAISYPDLLGSSRMRQLLAVLETRYDLIVLDSSPLLAVSDARILSSLADKTVFVVQWGRTRRDVVLTALRQLADAGADIAGIVLSKVNLKKYAYYSASNPAYYYKSYRKPEPSIFERLISGNVG